MTLVMNPRLIPKKTNHKRILKKNSKKKSKKKNISLKTKNQANPSKPLKPIVFSKTRNLWNSWIEFNQEAYFPNNFILNDEIVVKILI